MMRMLAWIDLLATGGYVNMLSGAASTSMIGNRD